MRSLCFDVYRSTRMDTPGWIQYQRQFHGYSTHRPDPTPPDGSGNHSQPSASIHWNTDLSAEHSTYNGCDLILFWNITTINTSRITKDWSLPNKWFTILLSFWVRHRLCDTGDARIITLINDSVATTYLNFQEKHQIIGTTANKPLVVNTVSIPIQIAYYKTCINFKKFYKYQKQ